MIGAIAMILVAAFGFFVGRFFPILPRFRNERALVKMLKAE